MVMIHSFSAADPTDPQTIAGRWLAQGAFVYFGSVNEPYLLAFRPPRLVAELMSAGVPLVAALRQGELELFGFPWRLVYLGDPLYRIQATEVSSGRPDADDTVPARTTLRVSPGDWRKAAPEDANWPVVEIASPGRSRGCQSRALVPSRTTPGSAGASMPRSVRSSARRRPSARPAPAGTGDWLRVLRKIRRDRLAHALRPFFDELLIDALEEAGHVDELATRLATIPPAERAPSRMAGSGNVGDDAARSVIGTRGQDVGLRPGARSLGRRDAARLAQEFSFSPHFTERVGALRSNERTAAGSGSAACARTGDALASGPRRQRTPRSSRPNETRVEAAGGGPVASP